MSAQISSYYNVILLRGTLRSYRNSLEIFPTSLNIYQKRRILGLVKLQNLELTMEVNEITNTIASALARPASLSFAGFIQSKLDEMGITKNYLCKAIKIDNKSLTRILSGEAQKVDVVTILKLGDFMQVDYSEFIKHYIAELQTEEIVKIKSARSAGIILRNFDLGALRRKGFIKSKSNFDEIETRILQFFGIESLLEYEQGLISLRNLFSRTRRSFSDKMLKFWCITAISELKIINNPYPFDLNQIKTIITRLSVLTSDELDGLTYAVRSLYRAGVTVLINPYLDKTQLRGATFIVNNKPCIVLQDFNKSYDTIWFALLHELCHIIKDLSTIRPITYHLSIEKGDGDLFIDKAIEDRANSFASELLLPDKKMKYVAGYIHVPGIVKKCAEKWQVSESIIYGQYAHRYKQDFYYSKTKKAEVAIKQVMVKNLYQDYDKIEKALEQVKNIYN